MALVDYASSGEESENDEEGTEKEEVNKSEDSRSNSNEKNVELSANTDNDSNGELFSSLPKPRKTFSVFEEENKLSKLLLNKDSLTVGKKEGVKISVPSISDFEDSSQEPPSKKIKASAKGTGLFSILPPPKNTVVKQVKRNLVPHAVSKIQCKKNYFKTDVKSTTAKQTDGDEDDEDIVGTSFFGSSLAQEKTATDPESSNIESSLSEGAYNNFVAPENVNVEREPVSVQNFNTDMNVNVDNHPYVADSLQANSTEPVSVNDNPLDLDEKALQILCGNKKKRQQMPMNIIDLSGEEVLPDSKEWLLKQFTEEKRGRSHGHKKSQGPSSQSRRKHQITYLAYQAKEQELELQNQWANNRMSRKQTQSKYGF